MPATCVCDLHQLMRGEGHDSTCPEKMGPRSSGDSPREPDRFDDYLTEQIFSPLWPPELGPSESGVVSPAQEREELIAALTHYYKQVQRIAEDPWLEAPRFLMRLNPTDWYMIYGSGKK